MLGYPGLATVGEMSFDSAKYYWFLLLMLLYLLLTIIISGELTDLAISGCSLSLLSAWLWWTSSSQAVSGCGWDWGVNWSTWSAPIPSCLWERRSVSIRAERSCIHWAPWEFQLGQVLGCEVSPVSLVVMDLLGVKLSLGMGSGAPDLSRAEFGIWRSDVAPAGQTGPAPLKR